MSKEAFIYQQDGLGWYVKMADGLAGPMDSCQDAEAYLNLIKTVNAARTETVCLDRECFC